MSKLSNEALTLVRDLAAFVRWADQNGQQKLILPTVMHDLNGFEADAPGWAARSAGYAAKEQLARTEKGAA